MWTKIAAFLVRRLAPHAKHPDRIKVWTSSLGGSLDSELLGVCLAIDIGSGALAPAIVAPILDAITGVAGDPRLEFQRSIDHSSRPRDLICSSSLPSPRLHPSRVYVRVLTIDSFISHYLAPDYPYYLPLSPAAKRLAQKRYLGPAGGNLGMTRRWWSGRRGVTWVLSSSTLDSLTGGLAPTDAANRVNDALGLAHPAGTELMYVRYPSTFDDVMQVTQPTSFDADWQGSGNFFLSYRRQDGWGRTQSCSGALASVKERVHGEVKNPTHEYRTHLIGKVAALDVDRLRLREEALKRVQEYL